MSYRNLSQCLCARLTDAQQKDNVGVVDPSTGTSVGMKNQTKMFRRDSPYVIENNNARGKFLNVENNASFFDKANLHVRGR